MNVLSHGPFLCLLLLLTLKKLCGERTKADDILVPDKNGRLGGFACFFLLYKLQQG